MPGAEPAIARGLETCPKITAWLAAGAHGRASDGCRSGTRRERSDALAKRPGIGGAVPNWSQHRGVRARRHGGGGANYASFLERSWPCSGRRGDRPGGSLPGETPSQIVAFLPRSDSAVDTLGMNDFHIALLWLRSLEIVIGHSPVLMLSELDMNDLFVRYRSPYKA